MLNLKYGFPNLLFKISISLKFKPFLKPVPYLDIIRTIKNNFKIPVFAYQVSGEYSMLANAINKKIVKKAAIFENLMSFKRAGANAIVSYYADRLNDILP